MASLDEARTGLVAGVVGRRLPSRSIFGFLVLLLFIAVGSSCAGPSRRPCPCSSRTPSSSSISPDIRGATWLSSCRPFDNGRALLLRRDCLGCVSTCNSAGGRTSELATPLSSTTFCVYASRASRSPLGVRPHRSQEYSWLPVELLSTHPRHPKHCLDSPSTWKLNCPFSALVLSQWTFTHANA